MLGCLELMESDKCYHYYNVIPTVSFTVGIFFVENYMENLCILINNLDKSNNLYIYMDNFLTFSTQISTLIKMYIIHGKLHKRPHSTKQQVDGLL